MTRFYEYERPIAFAEMAAAAGLVWASHHYDIPTAFALATDSSVFYHILSSGRDPTPQ
jgi:hypothetical protein